MSTDPGASGGRNYWMGFEARAASGDWLAQARERFPGFAAALEGSADRRRFLQLTAASMALMGLAGCGPEVKPRDREPYVDQPPGIVPGRARYYATATALQGYGCGVLIEHQMGRPIKVEGNPDHPASLGATSAIGQASILGLYDPYRAQAVTHDGEITTSEALAGALLERRWALRPHGGQGLALLTGAFSSPTLAAQIESLQHELPMLRWYQWEAVSRESVRAGAARAFGRPLELLPDFASADVIVAVDGDFLDSAPGHLRFARDFAGRRRAAEMRERMSRLYALESTPTLAGAKADHRWALAPAQIDSALRHLAAALGAGPAEWSSSAHPLGRELEVLAAELRGARGRALLQLGATQSADNHALAHRINHALGAYGTTLRAIEPVTAEPPDPHHGLSDLAAAIDRGEITTLVILDAANPAYTAPVELDFARALRRVPFSVYLGAYADETAAAVHWHVPLAHEYEAWSDIRAFDGTASVQQPQLRAPSARRSAHELLALLAGEPLPDGLRIVREYWRSRLGGDGGDFDTRWAQALRTGVVPGTAAAALSVTPKAGPPPAPTTASASPSAAATGSPIAAASASPSATAAANAAPGALTVLFRPDPYLWDGRFADNGWLQEMGRPFTRLTWDNAVLIAPRTAARLGLASGDLVDVALDGRTVRGPVWVLPGQADECITLELGFGRRRGGPVGTGVGFDAYGLRSAAAPWQAPGAELRKVGAGYPFAPIQREWRTMGRDVVREGTLAQFVRDPHFLAHPESPASLYPPFQYPGIAWAMSINLNACIGCHACVTACQAENNSPVVGKTEVWRNRDMHWLRIDRYYAGPPETPEVVFQPVPCMHCEDAPCEVVCPVHATVHDSEGLNVMVYNRCVGTRFCSNNCPYKVRRFNFFDYTAPDPRPPESWNPEVSVRGRGVMEKCTYCVQRTRAAMIDADRENRRVRDGEVLTACQQACPTQAITFGDRNDRASAVAQRKASPLDFVMLADLNTRPRTSYEALIRNPHPELPNG